MSRILLAILLSVLQPGLGQIFNREYKKGIILISLTFLLFISLLIGMDMELAKRLPPDAGFMDVLLKVSQSQEILKDILQKNSSTVATFKVLFFLVFIYSAWDAALGARERLSPPPEPPSNG